MEEFFLVSILSLFAFILIWICVLAWVIIEEPKNDRRDKKIDR